MVDPSFSIKGFWRGNEGTLNGIKFVLGGKGSLGFGDSGKTITAWP
jgi:hypothetical protein